MESGFTPNFAYPYYYLDMHPRRIYLLTKTRRLTSEIPVSALEGIFVSELEVPDSQQDFSITQKDKIADKYKGRFIDYKD
jgi:hypothetical protein